MRHHHIPQRHQRPQGRKRIIQIVLYGMSVCVIMGQCSLLYFLHTQQSHHDDDMIQNDMIKKYIRNPPSMDRFLKQRQELDDVIGAQHHAGDTSHHSMLHRFQEHPVTQKRVKSNNVTIDMRVLNQKLPFANPDGGVWTQGFDIQPKQLSTEEPLQIFVVPHSHCDPGWIKTFDDYFQSQTKHILTTVVNSLAKDKRRKFIWAEISYFEWWWKEQSTEIQSLTRKLIHNKQFEFVTGGWVQPDEANTQLYAMEIQLQEGHDFLRSTFGESVIPKYSWSIDPFGYSPTMAYLLNKFGFEGMLIQRVHYAIKKELAMHQNLEFIWRQTWDTTGEYDMFTHVMPFYSYDIPHTCGPDPSICCQFDFARLPTVKTTNGEACPWRKPVKEITSGNVKERSMLLLDQYRKKSSLYKSNVLIAPLGKFYTHPSMTIVPT